MMKGGEPSPLSPSDSPSFHPSLASIAKPRFVLVSLVSSVMISRAGPRWCSSYVLIASDSGLGLESRSRELEGEREREGEGEREVREMLSEDEEEESSSLVRGRWSRMSSH